MAASHLNKILSRKELIDVLSTDADVLLAHHAIFLRMNDYIPLCATRQSATEPRSI